MKISEIIIGHETENSNNHSEPKTVMSVRAEDMKISSVTATNNCCAGMCEKCIIVQTKGNNVKGQ